MGLVILLLLILAPIAEIALLIAIGTSIGIFETLALLILAGLLGVVLLRQQGLAFLSDLRPSLARQADPARLLSDAALIGLAAILLIVPGLLSDIAAILLLLPPVRALLARLWGRKRVKAGRAMTVKVIEIDSSDYRG